MSTQPNNPKTKYSGVTWIIILIFLLAGSYSLLGGYMRHQQRMQVRKYLICADNCKKIGTALEAYKDDNDGKYPEKLTDLSPKYLKTIPTCPAAGYDTYSEGYQWGTDPACYTFCCKGHHHKKITVPPDKPLPPDYPHFNSTTGLSMKPRHY